MTALILLLLWHPIIYGFNLWDRKVTKHGGKPNYLIYFLARGAAAIVHGAFMLIFLEDAYTNYGSLSAWQLLVLWFPYLAFQICTFWIQYEITRNIWTNEAWLYYDHQEKDSGIIDRFFARTGPTFHAIAKVMALAVAVFAAYIIWTRH
jgi:hypothetical protein